MNFTIKELNELIYSLGTTATKGMLCDKELNASLLDRLYDELSRKIVSEVVEEVDANINGIIIKNLKHTPSAPKKLGEGTAQSILDYVEENVSATHKEIQEYYKSLNGSNTFAYCLRNLIIPYKNRITQRYLAKTTNGKYVVRIANIHNWVEKYY
jgi:hypothetical protein